MFEQLLSYLESKPEPRSSRLTGVDQDTLAGTTLCVRWGSYLAVLMDGTKPLWSHANDPAVSAITDEEMARINIEVSAAFKSCLDLYRQDGGCTVRSLARRALTYLPVYKTIPRHEDRLSFLAHQETSQMILSHEATERVDRARQTAQKAPYRVIANALTNYAFRNSGKIEDVHAGSYRGSPLDRRRISPQDERGVLRDVNGLMKHAMSACFMLSADRSGRSEVEQALPFVLSWFFPRNWSVTEISRGITLPA